MFPPADSPVGCCCVIKSVVNPIVTSLSYLLPSPQHGNTRPADSFVCAREFLPCISLPLYLIIHPCRALSVAAQQHVAFRTALPSDLNLSVVLKGTAPGERESRTHTPKACATGRQAGGRIDGRTNRRVCVVLVNIWKCYFVDRLVHWGKMLELICVAGWVIKWSHWHNA